MASEILDCIIIVIIFALVLQVILKIIRKNEEMKNSSLFDGSETENYPHRMNITVDDDESHNLAMRNGNKVENNMFSINDNNLSPRIRDHMKNVILRNVRDKYEDIHGKTKHSESEINNYQNNFFGFRDTINQVSSNDVDVVDKLNVMNINAHNGRKISQVFDDLTRNNYR